MVLINHTFMAKQIWKTGSRMHDWNINFTTTILILTRESSQVNAVLNKASSNKVWDFILLRWKLFIKFQTLTKISKRYIVWTHSLNNWLYGSIELCKLPTFNPQWTDGHFFLKHSLMSVMDASLYRCRQTSRSTISVALKLCVTEFQLRSWFPIYSTYPKIRDIDLLENNYYMNRNTFWWLLFCTLL